MKYLKLLMLVAFASVLASCSDDETFNSKEVTVGFAEDTYSIRENAKFVDVPIEVKGERDGKVQITIVAEEVGEHPAKECVDNVGEGANYIITDKTLELGADGEALAQMSVQVAPIDDNVMNSDRTFKLTIISANGATIARESVVITIKDNDSAIYERFAGKWRMTAKMEDASGVSDFSKEITISSTTDDTKPEYDNILMVNGTAMFNVGADLDCKWNFRFSFDREAKTGTLGFICGETVSTFGGAYNWVWMSLDDAQNPENDMTATWSLDENDNLPNVISFGESARLGFYETAYNPALWLILRDIKLEKL